MLTEVPGASLSPPFANNSASSSLRVQSCSTLHDKRPKSRPTAAAAAPGSAPLSAPATRGGAELLRLRDENERLRERVAELEARVAELEAEVTDLGAARARLLKLEESIRKHLGEFCGRPDEVTTVGQILTTVKEKLRRLQNSRAHQAGAATAARDEREALLSAVDERLGPTWAADLDQLAAALGGCEAPPLRAAAVMLSEMRARAAQLDAALAAAVASAADERAVTAEQRAQVEKLLAERTELCSRISEARAWAADPDWGDENGLTSPSATASTPSPSTLPLISTMEWTTRFNNGRRRVYTDQLVLALTGIIRQFRLRGNRVAQLCHAVLRMFTGLSDEKLGELAPMPCPTSIKSYVRMRGSLAARWIGNAVINLWGLGVICDAGPGDRNHKFPWRVFLPWEVRDGGRCLNSVPKELWGAGAAQLTPTMDVATILADVALADHIKLTVKDFLGESGPSASGKTLCSVQFTSADACHVCKEVHRKPYTVALTKTYGERQAIIIYAPCADDGKGQLVYKQARRQTDAELMSAWAEDDDIRERAAKKAKVEAAAPGTTPFTDALLKVVAAETWAEKVEAATDALDVGNGKPVGTSAHYRAVMSLPLSDGRPGQPRAVVRVEYTKAAGFKLHTHYASSGKTFEVKPSGAAGMERPEAVTEFDFRAA